MKIKILAAIVLTVISTKMMALGVTGYTITSPGGETPPEIVSDSTPTPTPSPIPTPLAPIISMPAPTPLPYPTTAQNAYLDGQLIATIINHGSFFEEYRKGQKEITLQDDIVEFGNLKGNFIGSVFGGIYQDPTQSNLGEEAGLKLNLNTLLNNFVTVTPEWAWIKNIEYAPSVGYDFGQNTKHAWFAAFNVGFGFGPGAGVPVQ